MTFNVHQAKTNFSKLLRRVSGGSDVTIAKAGVPIARLVRIDPEHSRRPLGLDRGLFEVPEDFDAPLPDDILDAFEGAVPKVRAKKKVRRLPR